MQCNECTNAQTIVLLNSNTSIITFSLFLSRITSSLFVSSFYDSAVSFLLCSHLPIQRIQWCTILAICQPFLFTNSFFFFFCCFFIIIIFTLQFFRLITLAVKMRSNILSVHHRLPMLTITYVCECVKEYFTDKMYTAL